MTDEFDLRERVRQRYAESANSVSANAISANAISANSVSASLASTRTDSDGGGCCGDSLGASVDENGATIFGAGLYDDDLAGQGGAAVQASLGCGVPTAVADLHEGEVVLDLGSGAGGDALICARRVGPSGRVIGVDMTTEMLDLARRHAAEAGVTNVEFRRGYLEELPLSDATVDVVISNCVINLAADKNVVLAEAARVTRSGGRFAVSDVVAADGMDEATRADLAAHTGCIAGALTETEYREALQRDGWRDIEVRYTHRVHEFAQAAIVRAVRA